MGLKFVNNAVSALTAAIDLGAVSFEIDDASSFPSLSAGDWAYISIGTEIVKCTLLTGDIFTCEATTSAHSLGSPVILKTTAETLADLNTGLETVYKNDKEGLRRTDALTASRLSIGNHAIDMSYGWVQSSGASGDFSFSGGYAPSAIGENSIALGQLPEAGGKDSVAIGRYGSAGGEGAVALGDNPTANGLRAIAMLSGIASGIDSVAIGNNVVTNKAGSFSCGSYNASNYYGAMFELGIGTSPVDRKDGFVVMDTGIAITPEASISDIDAGDDKALVTKEYFETKYINVETTLYLSPDGDDDTGDGTSDSPWYSLEKAIDYLKDKQINTAIEVTIDIAAGNYVDLNITHIKHPQAQNISIRGDSSSTTTLNFTGYGIIIEGCHLKYIGSFKIKGVSATSQLIGLTVTGGASATIMGMFFDTWDGGLVVEYGSSIEAWASNEIFNCQIGVNVFRGSYAIIDNIDINCNSVEFSVGIMANNSSLIDAENATIINNGGYAIRAHKGSYVNADNSTFDTNSPDITSGDIPQFGNIGSWIFKS